MHSLAGVPNDTLKVRVEGNLHAANLHMLPKSLGRKVQSGLLVTYSRRHSLGSKVQSVLLVTCSRHLYSSAQKESRYCCQDEDLVPRDLYMGTMSTYQTQFRSKRYLLALKSSIYHKKHAHAGPGTTQVTATQWLIF